VRSFSLQTPEGKAARSAYLDAVAAWVAERKANSNADIGTPPPPDAGAPWLSQPSKLYNSMIAPIVPLTLGGVIWYQGESNFEGLKYQPLFESFVQGWRDAFRNQDLPFYWVQIAACPKWSSATREGQRRALRLKHGGMAVAIDLGNDVHPKNKQDVGHRLALVALAKTYGRDLAYSGPHYASHALENGKIRIRFDHLRGGLVLGNKTGLDPVEEVEGESVSHFKVQHSNGGWFAAEARIDGDSVVAWNKDIPDPIGVAYQPPQDNQPFLYNKAGLPTVPFQVSEKP
jgi:sialate O-acetylesterase